MGLALVVSLAPFLAAGDSSPRDGGRARGRGLGIVVALAFLLGLSGIVFAGLGAPPGMFGRAVGRDLGFGRGLGAFA